MTEKLITKFVNAKISGRNVHCFSENGQSTREQVIASIKTQYQYEFSIELLVW